MTLVHFFRGIGCCTVQSLCPKPAMPYYAHEKGPSTIEGLQGMRYSRYRPQRADLLTGGGFLPVQGCFCTGSGQILCLC